MQSLVERHQRRPSARYYHRETLPRDSLRLLRPRPSLINELNFDIFVVLRRTAPAYAAVSYTWGDDKPSKNICLNGRNFPVRPNLRACLETLASDVFNNKSFSRFLWVDAICIDQDNDQERNSQVSQMNNTYQCAQYVCVWLGPSLTEGLLEWKSWEDSIQELARRPYWTRFWVIQEFLLNRGVRIYCGRNSILLDEFANIAHQAANIRRPRATARELWDHFDGVTDLLPMLTLVMAGRDSASAQPVTRIPTESPRYTSTLAMR
ncbi:hypothetical protein NM208_g14153 [Fusarium decemcellulare]|uniref:Uncharacterized protein n=1 Tax=Fusarium decemcellulare TaxID=57161 RepID=A0ACC1RKL4_9HYPO|nr:hypothetical protein NM208_g14153 [Fusarium decemcellulare]